MKVSGRVPGLLAFCVVGVVSALLLRPHRSEGRPEPSSETHANNLQSARQDRYSAASGLPITTPEATHTPESIDSLNSFDSAESITLIGAVRARAQSTLSAQQQARILAVPIREGDTVMRGQLLAQLEELQGQTQAQEAQAGLNGALAQLEKAREAKGAQQIKADSDLDTSRAGLRQAQIKLKQAILAHDASLASLATERAAAQENIDKAQAGLDHARKTLQGLEELDKVGGVSHNDLEGARTQVRIEQADLAAAQTQAQSLNTGPGNGSTYRGALAQQDVDAAQEGVRQAQEGVASSLRARHQTLVLADKDLQAAAAAVEQAQASLSGAKKLQETGRLLSPLNGIVVGVSARIGETAQPGAPLVTVVAPDRPYVEAFCPARLVARLHIGQSAEVGSDTTPEQPSMAKVESISPVAEPDGRSFRVRFRLLNPHLQPLSRRVERGNPGRGAGGEGSRGGLHIGQTIRLLISLQQKRL